MDCSVYKEHKHSVAYGTLLNSCSFNTTYLEPKFFHLVLQLGWINAIIGRDSHDSTLLHKLTGSHVAYRTHMAISIFIWIKISKFSIKIWIFSGLLLFSALLLMAHQGGTRHSKSHPCYRKLLMLRMGQNLAKAMDTLHEKFCIIVEDNAFCFLVNH